jgi:predicted GIY-YIG superfamily endonuclease
VADQDSDAYMFTFEAVRRKAPSASGVYIIFTARQWVYVGESEDIQRSLFRHLNGPDASINQFGPLSFSFELAPADERKARQQALIAELEPACLLMPPHPRIVQGELSS